MNVRVVLGDVVAEIGPLLELAAIERSQDGCDALRLDASILTAVDAPQLLWLALATERRDALLLW